MSKKVSIRWDVDPDNCAPLESRNAGKSQFMVELHASFGPFNSYDEASEFGCAVRDKLPSTVIIKG